MLNEMPRCKITFLVRNENGEIETRTYELVCLFRSKSVLACCIFFIISVVKANKLVMAQKNKLGDITCFTTFKVFLGVILELLHPRSYIQNHIEK